MPKMYISEFDNLANFPRSGLVTPAAQTPAIVQQMVDYSTSSLQSAVFNEKTRFVRVHVDGVAHVIFGDNPTATTNSMRMAADQTEYFGVTPGQRLAVIGV